jgi:hypothetical protein
MNAVSSEDTAHSHRAFSADFYNRTWELLEKPARTPAEDEKMISFSHASLAHWRERADCQQRNLSIGYWQLSRVYAVLGQAGNAAHYGQLCLEHSLNEPPFFLAYAHEALARAARLGGDFSACRAHLDKARSLAGQVADVEERQMLTADLDSIGA